jgi:hypothetical protein
MHAMENFIDSTDILDDGPALAERLERDGYLFIRRLLQPETVLRVRRRLLEKASAGGWLDPESPVEWGVACPAAACKDPEDSYMKVFRGIWADEELHRLRTQPAVLALFERIFGEPALAHPLFIQRNIFPQSEDFDFTTGAHQDRVHIGGATSYAVWLPLHDCPPEQGSLAVAAGSHRAGIFDTTVGNGAGGMEISGTIPGAWVTGSFAVGDALVFMDHTVHRALPNRTRVIRQSVDARYQRVSQPVADKNLETYAGTGTWEEIYAQWQSTEDQYYWRNFDLEVIPFDFSYYERRDEMAFEMAENGDLSTRDTLLRIVQRDHDPQKRARAEQLLTRLESGAG